VAKGGEDLPLPQKPLAKRRLRANRANEFDRHLLLYFAIDPLPKEDRAHAPFSQQAHQPIGATADAGYRPICVQERLRCRRHRCGQASTGGIEAKEGFHCRADRGRDLILSEVALALLVGDIGHFPKDQLNFGPHLELR
jgi:hypothetical protein